jgi:hypothetical protein
VAVTEVFNIPLWWFFRELTGFCVKIVPTVTLAAGANLGPYEIVAPIGAGGMGEVYRARDPRMGREVAIKIATSRRCIFALTLTTPRRGSLQTGALLPTARTRLAIEKYMVQPFPMASAGKWKLGSGSQPLWRRDGCHRNR